MKGFSSIIKLTTDILTKASRNLVRDYNELQSLQSSKKSTYMFAERSIQRSQQILFGELERVRPKFGMRSSMFRKQSEEENEASWIVSDFIGKDNFAHAMPFFGLAISSEEKIGDEFAITNSIMFFPILNEFYFAERGKGAWHVGSGVHYSGGTTRLRVSSRLDNESCIKSGVFDKRENRSFGCDLLSAAYVASGKMEACRLNAKHDDIVHAFLIVRESGGSVYKDGSEDCLSNGVVDK